MSGDGKSTVVDRPGSVPSQDRAEPEAPRRESRRRSVPPASRYESGDEIGRGGMGRVVEATDTLLDRRVAVKEALTTDPELLRRFARETKITARLEHPSIVPVYDAGTVDDAPYYVMRRVSGRPLSELIRAAPTLNERLALVPHLLAAAQAIAHAHQRGIIHRDIKPSNILVGELGETVVIDWGLAKVLGEPDDAPSEDREPGASTSLRTRIGSVFGTPGFMDPNQLRGDAVGPQGDVYSLGASLYNLLAAEPPHYASDSTLMMKLASQGPAEPIAKRVQGVPAELSTIVDRATDYDTERRYKDAGQFAEELKRFLAGQLVASHEYSRVEHVVRFVRKHRAAVAIGTAATILLAIIGTFAVSQVIEERDRADDQARLATQGRHEAEAARAMADERADLLLISRASALLETNPTAALASLKQLSPTSKRIADARAIATSARLRGVAWAMKGADGHPGVVTLDPSARHLAEVSSNGMLHVYDLERRRLAFESKQERGTQVRWIRDGKQLLVGGRGATQLLSPSGTKETTDLPAFDLVETDERGVILLGIDPARRALRIDLETGARADLAADATGIQISTDGAYCAVTTKTDFIIYDANGKVLLHRPHANTIVRGAFGKTKVAVLDNARVYQAPLEAGATWAPMRTSPDGPYVPLWLDYTNDRLFAVFADSRVFIDNRGVLMEIGRMESTSGTTQPFGRDYLVVGVDGRRIYYVDGATMRMLYLPIAMRFVRIVARAAHSRVVAIGDGAIVVLELDTLPTLVPIEKHQATVFITNTMLMSSSAFTYNYAWLDLVSHRFTHAATGGSASMLAFDRADGRMLAIEQVTDEGRRALIFEAGGALPAQVLDTPFEEIQLVTGGGLVYSAANKVYGGFAGVRRPELFTTDGRVEILVRIGTDEFAAITDRELVRSNLRTGALVRMPLDAGPEISYAIAMRGSVVIARGEQLLRWDKSLEPFATLESPPTGMFVANDNLLATLSNHSAVFIDNAGKVTRLSSSRGDTLGSAQRAVVPGQFHYDVIELPSLARWGLPINRAADMADAQLDLSPDGEKLIEKRLDGRLWLWKLPVGETLANMVSATNFVEDQNGLLLWPWQSADPKK